MKTNVCKIALMFLIGTALSLLFNSCSKDPVIPENETDNKLHEDPSKMTIRLVECHLHADWNEIQKVGGPHQNPESPADRCFLLRNSAVSRVRPGIRKILRLAAGFHREIFRCGFPSEMEDPVCGTCGFLLFREYQMPSGKV